MTGLQTTLSACVWLLAASLVPARAEPPPAVAEAAAELSESDREVLREYYRAHRAQSQTRTRPLRGPHKRVARGQGLPAGWESSLGRGLTVPADIWVHHEPVPVEVIGRLPPQPAGVLTVRIEDKIVRVVAATHVVLDVFDLF